ncbi:MAG: C-methyltransferase [Candidatus Magasanikbacteria bacterium]|nr:C-methyltransferase [Candidatus Magasanikbacteria bacterium]
MRGTRRLYTALANMQTPSTDLQSKATSGLYTLVKHCRMCRGTSFSTYLDLGFHPPSDQFRTPEEQDLPEITYPLRVMLCMTCGLSQLTHVVDPRILYQHDYPYESSTTRTGKRHWDEYAASVVRRCGLAADALVIDIGSNVGTLLESFRGQGMRVLGIDPAPNIAAEANANGVDTICAFFNRASAKEALARVGQAAVVTGTNVFAHIDDLDDVMAAVDDLLQPGGVFIFESPYMRQLVAHFEYDTIYHEHLSYLSLKPVMALVARHGYEVFAVEETDIHGGSIRVYIGRQGDRAVDEGVGALLVKEEAAGIHRLEALQHFAARVAENREKLVWIIEELLHAGKKVVAVSAPAKGMTLLNYCGLHSRQLRFATEKSALKIGRLTPGGHIPVVSDNALTAERPDYALLLAWNFAPEIMANLSSYREHGGKFIIPIPEPRIE